MPMDMTGNHSHLLNIDLSETFNINAFIDYYEKRIDEEAVKDWLAKCFNWYEIEYASPFDVKSNDPESPFFGELNDTSQCYSIIDDAHKYRAPDVKGIIISAYILCSDIEYLVKDKDGLTESSYTHNHCIDKMIELLLHIPNSDVINSHCIDDLTSLGYSKLNTNSNVSFEPLQFFDNPLIKTDEIEKILLWNIENLDLAEMFRKLDNQANKGKLKF
jgi:hypothetical protein